MNEISLLSELNEAQIKAVSAPLCNMLVLAGAGSGKTRVLVHRIAWLIDTQNVSPMSILGVTFTNKAAHEMRLRIETLLGRPMRGMWVGTFHNLAHRLLRSHWHDAGLPETFQIIDSDDQLRLVKRIIKALEIDEEKWPAKKAQWFINGKKDEGLRASHIPANEDYHTSMQVRIYQSYEETCERGGLVDFAELLLRAHELWLNNPELLKHYQARFPHILVDEFQDTNSIQYAWLRLLAGDKGNIIAVGDDDQSIYSWRGAQVGNIQRFTEEFSAVTTIRLEQNYRSTETILNAANTLIRVNSDRMGKELWTNGDKGNKITVYSAFNEIEEATFISDQVSQAVQQGYKMNDIAILYRSNAQSRVIEEAFLRGGFPYCIFGGLRFFERAEIKDALAYLRLMTNPNDDSAFDRIYNTPTRGIGARSMMLLREFSRSGEMSLWQAAKEISQATILTARAALAIQGFVELIEGLQQRTEDASLEAHIQVVLEHSGLTEHHQKEGGEKSRARIENLRELVTAAKQFEIELQENQDSEDAHIPVLSAFLTHTALEAGDKQAMDYEDCVKMMTLHTAKGLEFPYVILSGLEEGLFPHQMSLREENRLEEERRLCYVGMTRAKKQLVISHAESRRLYGREMACRRSRFIDELPEECLHFLSQPKQYSRQYTSSYQKQPAPKKVFHSKNTAIDETEFCIGQSVHHPKFGEGVLTDMDGSGERLRVEIKFRAGSKWLLMSKAKLAVV
jgi:DNA helicase-2/ATP-dependent DNA helicase PcrA